MIVDYADLPKWAAVSRETFADLVRYQQLVEKWNPTINLVSKSGIADIWFRHILDSAQLFDVVADRVKAAQSWSDLGSGGGFPGLVVAILAKHRVPFMKTILVESDRRKSVFLAEVGRQLELNILVLNQRVEDVPSLSVDILSARGLASLDLLCAYGFRHLGENGVAVFPKGKNHMAEIGVARNEWDFKLVSYASHTDPTARLLILEEIQRANRS